MIVGNANAMKNGHRSKRPGTVLQRLGPRYKQAYSDVLRLRKQAERSLGRVHAELTLTESASLQTICRLELAVRIAEKTIATTPDLPPEELRALLAVITQWSAQRDNRLAKLLAGKGGVDPATDPWSILDRPTPPATPEVSAAVPAAEVPPESTPESEGGNLP